MNDASPSMLSSEEALQLHDILFGHMWMNVTVLDFLCKKEVISKLELAAYLEKSLAYLKKIGANEKMLRNMEIYCSAIRTGRPFPEA